MATRLMLLVLLIGLIAGCSGHSTSPTAPASTNGLQVAPADGATTVPIDATVTLSFNTSMDRPAVEGGFHLLGEADTARACPYPGMHHGSLDSMMSDRDWLAHMDAYHSTAGRFTWNGAGTYCTFRPDSLLRPQTRYMIHIGPTMLGAMNQAGCRWNGGQATSWGDRMTHFRTTAGSGHDGYQ